MSSTIAESGYPDYRVSVWYGIAAPAKLLPDDIAAKVSASLDRALNDDAFRVSPGKSAFRYFVRAAPLPSPNSSTPIARDGRA